MTKRASLCAFVGGLVISLSSTVAARQSVVTTFATPPDLTGIAVEELPFDVFRPVLVTHAGDGSGRLFVVQQDGKIFIIHNGEKLPTPFLDVSQQIVSNLGPAISEQGLLGMAFDPDYAQNGRFFISYTSSQGELVVARYRVSADDRDLADPFTFTPILVERDQSAQHNGGHLAFGRDGYLYIGWGDDGTGSTVSELAQDLSSRFGKILRIDVSGDTYTVPADNPFVGRADAQPEIWAYGLRNPWRYSFDRATGDLYIGDVGHVSYEELNFQPASSPGGENYGWNAYEGLYPRTGVQVPIDTTLPIIEYARPTGGSAIVGGYVYRGSAFPNVHGVYFYTDFISGTIWAAWRDESRNWRYTVFVEGGTYRPTSFGEDEAGELYFTWYYRGKILKLVPAAP